MRYKIEKMRDINDAKSFMHGYQMSCSFQMLKYTMYFIVVILITLVIWSQFAQKNIVVDTFGVINVDKNTCEIYIENTRISNISPDKQAHIQIVSLPKNEYGEIVSKIKEVSNDVVIDKESGKSFFRASCNLNKKFLENKNREKVQLKNGMEAKVSILCKTTTYFDYFLNKIG